MIEEQKMTIVKIEELQTCVDKLYREGYRLVQIGATQNTDGFEVNYSFDKEYHFLTIRVMLPACNPRIPSVSGIYLSAFLYENEIHDLFGITVSDMALDYKGNFYRTGIKTPFVNNFSREKEKGL